jgi:hypothetical protein
MKSLLRKAGIGGLALRLYHRPLHRLRDCLREGGPWQQRRTELGRQDMEMAAYKLPLLAAHSGAPLELHLLTGRRFWYQTAFCLWTLGYHADRPLAPVIYDDGTLVKAHRDALTRLFPTSRFVAEAETIARLDAYLPTEHFPVIRERWLNYPNLRKLIDPHLGSSGWKLVLDSDLLFFRKAVLLENWLDAPDAPLHAVDVANAYGYSDKLLNSLISAPLPQRLNVGLCGLRSEELDWERIEYLCGTLIDAEQTNYYLEQALVALLLAGRKCAIAPADDYVTLPVLPEAETCSAVMHHYVANSKRWYFQFNWRRCLPTSSA